MPALGGGLGALQRPGAREQSGGGEIAEELSYVVLDDRFFPLTAAARIGGGARSIVVPGDVRGKRTGAA